LFSSTSSRKNVWTSSRLLSTRGYIPIGSKEPVHKKRVSFSPASLGNMSRASHHYFLLEDMFPRDPQNQFMRKGSPFPPPPPRNKSGASEDSFPPGDVFPMDPSS
jgi:hypothetical protein